MLEECKNPIHRHGVWYRTQTTLQRLLHRFFNTARDRKGKKALSKVCENSRRERKLTTTPKRLPALSTNLIDLHEFGVGAWPFYGHLDNVRGRRHCKPREYPETVALGSCGVDSCTCLSLMRMTKREKRKVAQCRRKANSASSLPVFTGGLGTRNGSGYRRHKAPTAPPATPEERRQMRGRCQRPRVKAARRHGPGEGPLA